MLTRTEVTLPEEVTLSDSGADIHVRIWRPQGPPRAVLAICHGLNSHGGQYAWVAEQMVDSDYAVYALDLRGRGRSSGERFFVEKVEDYVADVHAMILHAKRHQPGLPVYLLGHSAGGVTSCIYALEHPSELAGLVCESFAFRVPAPDIALALLKGFSHIAPHSHVMRLKNEDFSRDPAVVARLNTDPLIAGESQPAQTVAALVRADERLEREMPQIKLPLLILHGTADKATRPSGSEFFHQQAGSLDKTLKLYEGYFHDLLSDVGREQVLEDIRQWIEQRLPVAGPVASSPSAQ